MSTSANAKNTKKTQKSSAASGKGHTKAQAAEVGGAKNAEGGTAADEASRAAGDVSPDGHDEVSAPFRAKCECREEHAIA